MRRLLLFDLFAQVIQLLAGAIDHAPRLFQLLAIHLDSGARQPPAGTLDRG